MIARTPQNQKNSLLSAVALFAFASTVAVLGCRSNQPEPATQPGSAAPSAADFLIQWKACHSSSTPRAGPMRRFLRLPRILHRTLLRAGRTTA